MPQNRKQRKPKPFSSRGGPNAPGWHDGVAARLNDVSGIYVLTEIAGMTGANPETIRRYLNTGKMSVQFLSAFCLAYQVDPWWLLFGGEPRKLRGVGPSSKGAEQRAGTGRAHAVINTLRRALADAERDLVSNPKSALPLRRRGRRPRA